MTSFLQSLKSLVDKLPHWLILVLASGVGAVLSYFQAEPDARILLAFTSWGVALPMLKGALVAFAGTVVALLKTAPWQMIKIVTLGPDGTVKSARLAPAKTSSTVPPLALLAFVALGLAACNVLASLPADVTLAACVVAHDSEPVAQIAIDCVADVPAVIAALLASKDPHVAASRAYGEATRTRAMFVAAPADAGAP